MILLDDYDVKYKIHGVFMTQSLLEGAAPELLRRTGVDGLIYSVRLGFPNHSLLRVRAYAS